VAEICLQHVLSLGDVVARLCQIYGSHNSLACDRPSVVEQLSQLMPVSGKRIALKPAAPGNRRCLHPCLFAG